MFSKGIQIILSILLLCISGRIFAQQEHDLGGGWKCNRADAIKAGGEQISKADFPLNGWMDAVVPGTVLTTLLHNHLIPDPFYGRNNDSIPDISTVGRAVYTYWFVRDIKEKQVVGQRTFLNFRGVNYGCDIYLNGKKVNANKLEGMYLRHRLDITAFLAADGNNRLAVIVYPPDPVGRPNGGQGGDGLIARNLTNQYVAGWDWIQPIADRNTGIWDKVTIERTAVVTVSNTHVITKVPGTRQTTGPQAPALIQVSTELENADTNNAITGKLIVSIDNGSFGMPALVFDSFQITLKAGEKRLFTVPEVTISDPALWWPNGYGEQPLYNVEVFFYPNKHDALSFERIEFGIRELKATWNAHTQSRELYVNGKRIFLKGGNRILSDELLRFTPERYDAEMRFHRDMNLNLIRVWGGGITERPEFYEACDRYGLLVMQDFWVSGDCNGRWYDQLKTDDTTTRRKYPDDHSLFLKACIDQIKMLRNHPSLALWCGGNEIRPPADILQPLRDSILPQLDGTRFFFEYSNDDSMSLDAHDGPYTIQRDNYFWEHRSWGFNSEIGSVGIGDLESLERFLPASHLKVPQYNTAAGKWTADSMWQFHKYYSYDSSVEKYGHPRDISDFTKKAQLVNYNQYRSLMESFIAHKWDWYTGVIIWKTQNPWTAMVGQMYDVYLDPNACLYGLAEGAKPTHAFYNPISDKIIITNELESIDLVKLEVIAFDRNGKELMGMTYDLPADSLLTGRPYTCCNIKEKMSGLADTAGVFLCLRLSYVNDKKHEVDENLYWLPNKQGDYTDLAAMPEAHVKVDASLATDFGYIPGSEETITVHISNPKKNTIAFFNRISLVNSHTKKRILPVFYNNNYISILPGQQQTITIAYHPQKGVMPSVCIEGWNVNKKYIAIKRKKK